MKFNVFVFLGFFSLITVAGMISFFFAAAVDEGNSIGAAGRMIADTYSFFRFPTHTFFFDVVSKRYFFSSLLVNWLLAAFVIERIYTGVSVFRRGPRNQENIAN